MLMEKSWLDLLQEEFSKEYMLKLKFFLTKELQEKKTIYPPQDLIFNALCQTPFEQVKVVIMGQDPYHGIGQAHGLSFSVPEGVKPPPSLKNVYKELVEDVGISLPKTGCLLPWAKQGVLLLNATLTVREGEPKSHYGQGWELFTDVIIEKLALKKDPMVFLLWGKSAEKKVGAVLDKIDISHHLILKAAHPSFYSVENFFGCKHFSKTNRFLKQVGKTPINWSVE